jgi:hypothetical protein
MIPMETKYYCKVCDEHFKDGSLPNMNRRHHCGNIARVVMHDPNESYTPEEY